MTLCPILIEDAIRVLLVDHDVRFARYKAMTSHSSVQLYSIESAFNVCTLLRSSSTVFDSTVVRIGVIPALINH